MTAKMIGMVVMKMTHHMAIVVELEVGGDGGGGGEGSGGGICSGCGFRGICSACGACGAVGSACGDFDIDVDADVV